MVSASDGSAFTGSVTVSVTGDAGTQATGSVGSGACTHEGNGYHTYAPAQAETNYDLIAFTFTGTGAVPATVQLSTSMDSNVTKIAGTSQTAKDLGAINVTNLNTLSSHDPGATLGTSTLTQTQVTGGAYALNSASFAFNSGLDLTTTQKASVNTEADTALSDYGALKPTTAGRTLDVTATGEAGIDWANIGSPTTAVNLSGTTVKTATDVEADTQDIQSRLPAALTGGGNIKADVIALSGDTTAADNAESFFDGTGYAGTNNVIPLVTTTTNLTNNLTAANVWAAATRTLTALDEDDTTLDIDTTIRSALGLVDNDLGTRLDTIDGNVDSILADTNELQTDWVNGGRLDLILDARASQTSVDTIDGIVDSILLDTAEIGAAGAGLTALASASALATVDSNVDAIKVITDELGDTLEDDGGTYRFTANALEQAPTGGSAPTAADIADAVWEELLTDHSGTTGSTAEALGAAGSAGDPWATALPGAYGSGSAGKIIGDNINATISSRASQTSVDDVPTNAELATALGTADDATLSAISAVDAKIDIIDTNVDSVKSKTDSLTFTTANRVDSTAITVSDKTGYALSSGGVQAIWDALTSALTTSGSIGKWIVDKLDVVLSTRLASASYTAPDNSSITSIKTKTDQLTFGTANRVDAQVYGIQSGAVTAAAIASDAITDAKVASDVTIASVTGAVGSVTGNVGGNVTGSVGSVATGGITAASIATDAIDADAIATDAVTEIQSGLSTLNAAGVRTAIGLASANLDTQLDALPTNAELATALGTADDAVLSAIAGLNNVSTAQVQTAAAAALTAYDPPTRAEATSDKDAILAILGTPNLGDIASDIADVRAGVDNVETDTQDIQSNLGAVKTKTDSLTFTVAGNVDANVQYVNDTQVAGTGESGDEWGPV